MAPITEDDRRKVVAAAAAAAAAAPGREVGSVSYKGEKLPLPVARVPLEYVLLNPGSHRIRAQLRSRPAADYQTVKDHPYDEHAQRLLRTLLQRTDGYRQIRTSLQREGQEEAGVITADGVLINANTRAVALMELGNQYIDVMVLPDDATQRELDDLELTLQMARDLKQEYSFTSQLLFIEDLIDAGWSIEQLGMRLRPDLANDKAGRKEAVQHVQQELRLLSLIRDVLELGDGAATFVQFDERRQALIEIADDYELLKNKRPLDAARVRDAQLAGMLADIDYRRLRNVDLTLLDKYLPAAVRDHHVLGDASDVLLTDDSAPTSDADTDQLDGLALLDEDESAAEQATSPSFKTILTLLAQAGDDEFVVLPGADPAKPLTRATFAAAVNGVFDTAFENRRAQDDAVNELVRPEKFVLDAARLIDNARTAFADVHNRGDFDRDGFLAAREELDRALEELANTVDAQLGDVTDA